MWAAGLRPTVLLLLFWLLDERLLIYQIFLNYFNKSGVIEDIIKQYIASLINHVGGILYLILFISQQEQTDYDRLEKIEKKRTKVLKN